MHISDGFFVKSFRNCLESVCASFKVFLYVKRAKKNKIQRKKEAQAAADSEAAAQAAADPEAALKDYVDTYASMKPKDAAKVFDSMMPDQTDLVVKILEQMTPDQRSAILAKMTVTNSVDLTVKMDEQLPQ